jgi:hypothetical protein
MSHIAIPILALRATEPKFVFNNDIQEVFEAADAWQDREDFTYTGRLTVGGDDEQADAKKVRITSGLRAMEADGRLDVGQADVLLALFNANDWDISFYVDTF